MMATMASLASLARCTGDPACPVRFRHGPPRRCVDHDDERVLDIAARSLGIDLDLSDLASTAPGDRGTDGRRAG